MATYAGYIPTQPIDFAGKARQTASDIVGDYRYKEEQKKKEELAQKEEQRYQATKKRQEEQDRLTLERFEYQKQRDANADEREANRLKEQERKEQEQLDISLYGVEAKFDNTIVTMEKPKGTFGNAMMGAAQSTRGIIADIHQKEVQGLIPRGSTMKYQQNASVGFNLIGQDIKSINTIQTDYQTRVSEGKVGALEDYKTSVIMKAANVGENTIVSDAVGNQYYRTPDGDTVMAGSINVSNTQSKKVELIPEISKYLLNFKGGTTVDEDGVMHIAAFDLESQEAANAFLNAGIKQILSSDEAIVSVLIDNASDPKYTLDPNDPRIEKGEVELIDTKLTADGWQINLSPEQKEAAAKYTEDIIRLKVQVDTRDTQGKTPEERAAELELKKTSQQLQAGQQQIQREQLRMRREELKQQQANGGMTPKQQTAVNQKLYIAENYEDFYKNGGSDPEISSTKGMFTSDDLTKGPSGAIRMQITETDNDGNETTKSVAMEDLSLVKAKYIPAGTRKQFGGKEPYVEVSFQDQKGNPVKGTFAVRMPNAQRAYLRQYNKTHKTNYSYNDVYGGNAAGSSTQAP